MFDKFKCITYILSTPVFEPYNRSHPGWKLTYDGHILQQPIIEKICVKNSKKDIKSFEFDLSMKIDSKNSNNQNLYEFKLEKVERNGFHLLFTVYDMTTVLDDKEDSKKCHQADLNYSEINFLSVFVENGMKIVSKNGSVNLSVCLNSFTSEQSNNLSSFLRSLKKENKRFYLSIPMYFADVIDYWYWDNMSFEINSITNSGSEDSEITEHTYQRQGIGLLPLNRNYPKGCLEFIKNGMKGGVIPSQTINSFMITPKEDTSIDTESDDISLSLPEFEMVPFWKTVSGVCMLINLSIFSVVYILFFYKLYFIYFPRRELKD